MVNLIPHDVDASLKRRGAANVARHLNRKVPHGRCPAANLPHISTPGVAMVQTPVVFHRCHRILSVLTTHISFNSVVYFTLKMEAEISL